jgi:serine/threonine-protein kinase
MVIRAALSYLARCIERKRTGIFMTLPPGTPISHYKIGTPIGEGSTGDVYRAENIHTGQMVAIKIPNRTTLSDPRQYDYFLRELDAMSILIHPAVQHKLDSGREGSTPFLVTELIDGQSLGQVIKTRGTFSEAEAVALMLKLVDGIAYCHAQGVIHRDLKPENVLMVGDQPVIIDFGLALTPKHPNAGSPAGTPEYVSPEQVTGQKGDRRTDIYALGIIFFELLAGQPPFTGTDVMTVLQMRLYQAVPRLDVLCPGVSPITATIIARCMQRRPDNRYQDMSELIADLNHPDTVDTSVLAALTAPPPKQSFWRTQPGQALLTTLGFFAVIVLLTLLLIALKRLNQH